MRWDGTESFCGALSEEDDVAKAGNLKVGTFSW
jgi:hypothetical protein